MTPLLFLYDPLKGINQAFYFFENLQIFQKNQKFQKVPKSPNLAIFVIKKNYEIKKFSPKLSLGAARAQPEPERPPSERHTHRKRS